MKFLMKLSLFLLILSVFITACTQTQPITKEPSEPEISQPTPPNQNCGDYIRNDVKESYCAICGNNICEPFETCVPSECNEEGCIEDCGPLYCNEDCFPSNEEEETYPSVVPKLPEITATLRTCRIDSDCVRIEADCCGCGGGGTADSINKEYQQDWHQTRAQKCQNIMCPAVMSNHWTCTSAEPKCVLNKCKLVRE